MGLPWYTSVSDNLVSDQTLGSILGDGVLSEMLGNLQDGLGLKVLDLQSIENLSDSFIKLIINDSTNDGDNFSLGKSNGSISIS